MGARVVSTVSGEEKASLARAAGADLVVNYRASEAADEIRAFAPEGIDRIVELALGPNLELDLAVAAPHAVISTYAADVPTATVPVRALMTPNLVLRFVLVYTIGTSALRSAVDGVSQAVAAGALSTLPLHRFPLAEAAAAHDAVEAGAVGKVLIDLP
jgi:NADPH2:quinone reductase